MKIIRIRLFTFLFFIWLAAPVYGWDSDIKLVNKVQPSIVLIVTYDARGKLLQQGSGFFVAHDKVVTNGHVIADSSHSQIITANGRVCPVKGVVASDEGADLVLLHVKAGDNQGPPLVVREDPPGEGERVYVIGHGGGGWSVTSGDLLAICNFKNVGERMRITARIVSGTSGSPVLNSDGQVIGVAASVFTSNEPLYFAIPAQRLISLMSRS